jgi:cellulose synthase/poly-beta-1,6-N-acetylglucosamine synthase-like glycosyltransferase
MRARPWDDPPAGRKPHLLVRTPALRRALFAAYLVATVLYLVWRVLFTLSPEHPVYAVAFVAAEAFALVLAVFFYILILRHPGQRSAPPPPEGLEVDVFITTYNEELALIRTTASAARDMDYPHRTWICDDGRRPEVEALARELGVGYLSRPTNEHYKAGNLNNALAQTRGDAVLILDADHVVRRCLLTELLGHLRDPAVALVQTPQVFYNVESYQHAVSVRRRSLWHEGSLFHHLIQPGASRLNAAFFVGTGALLRRSALEAIGGFATGSITEDIHTSIRLHAAGFKVVYVDQALGFLLAPDTPLGYTSQRLRWAQGAMQILRRENPLFQRGLSFWQRCFYLNALIGFLVAYQQVLFYLAPGFYLYTRISPILVDPRIGFTVFAAHIALDLIVFKLLAAPHARIFFSECYKMLNIAIYVRGSAALLHPDGLPFRVTPKSGSTEFPVVLLMPAAVLFLFNLTAVGVGLTSLLRGEAFVGAVLISGFFSALFSIAAALALLHAYERRQVEETFVFPVQLPSHLESARDGQRSDCLIRRLSHEHAYIETAHPCPAGSEMLVDLGSGGVERAVRAVVVSSTASGESQSPNIVKLSLTDLTQAERDELDRYFFNTALPQFFEHFIDTPPGPPPDVPLHSRAEIGPRLQEFLQVRGAIV